MVVAVVVGVGLFFCCGKEEVSEEKARQNIGGARVVPGRGCTSVAGAGTWVHLRSLVVVVVVAGVSISHSTPAPE